MSLEEISNIRDLEREKLEKTAERIRDGISGNNFQLVLKYKEYMASTLEKWEALHLQVANLSAISISTGPMKQMHQEVLDIAYKADIEADNYYNELKKKRKEERQAEKALRNAELRAEQAKKEEEEKEASKPILKEYFTNEVKEINKIVLDYALKIENKKVPWTPEPFALMTEIKYIEERFEKAVRAYNQFVFLSTDKLENEKLRELKNTEERSYRRELMRIKSFVNTKNLDSKSRDKINNSLPTRQNQQVPTFLGPTFSDSKMANEKEVLKSFEENIMSISMDDRHVLVGLVNGKVGCIYSNNKKEKFVTEVASVPITAVLADPLDTAGKSLFYAGDQKGFLHVLGEKGDLINSLKVRDGPIFAIQDVEVKKVWVYSDKGRSVVTLEGTELKIKANKNSKFSMDLDARFHQTRDKGDFALEEFDARVPARIYGCPRVMLESSGDDTAYINAFAYATDSETYRRELVEDSKAPTTLEITGKGQSKIRTIEMGSPVKQVLNCFVKSRDIRKDAMYVLTNDDKITKFVVSELLDDEIPDSSLTRKLIFEEVTSNENEMDDIGDIETFTCRLGMLCFTMRDSDEAFVVEDKF